MNTRETAISRRDKLIILIVVALAVIGSILVGSLALRAADTGRVQLDVSKAGPRSVEEQTEKGILRDYTAAWKAYTAALEQNNPGALADLWVGFARTTLADGIAQQKASGVSVRYLDHGHKVEAVFYAPEGSALELHDTAQLERQVLDGGSVVASENITEHYLVMMTPTSDHWQVRVFQSVPGF